MSNESAFSEIVADISPSDISSPEIAVDISASEVDDDLTFSEEDTLDDQGRDDLLSAALDDNWEKVVEIVTYNPSWLHKGITTGGDSILHMAIIESKVEVLEALIGIDPSSLRYTNKNGSNAFFFAASSGVVEIAEIMIQYDEELPHIRGAKNMTPLHRAVTLNCRDMVEYLLKITDDTRLFNTDRIDILIWSITHNFFDVALQILKDHLELASMRDSWELTALHLLARRPLKLADGHQPSIREMLSGRFTAQGYEPKPVLELTRMLWCRMLLQHSDGVGASIEYPWSILATTVRMGKVEFLKVLIRYYPPILSAFRDEKEYSIIHHAVIHRQPKIFTLIYAEQIIQNVIVVCVDQKQNSVLHLAGKLAPRHSLSNVSEAALQMQRELQWFQAVKQCIRYDYIEAQNADRETPQDLFSKEHEELRKQGEDWMKKTAESCALVAALVTTINHISHN